MEIKQKDFITFLKKAYQRSFLNYGHTSKFIQLNDEAAGDKITHMLQSPDPFMIGRFGSTELQSIAAYTRQNKYLKNNNLYSKYHWGNALEQIHILSGFFPDNDLPLLKKFANLMLEDSKQLDILGSWRKEEYYVKKYLTNAVRIPLNALEPYFSDNPWSRHLENKKVLVIHPFTNTIERQYEQREHLFVNSKVLPSFNLNTIRAVQTIAGNPDPRFSTWFDALDFMKTKINTSDFDVALIGCGAYGFPLAAHVKRIGKKAIHMGGALQILFGIRGKRWDEKPKFKDIINKHWIYPMDEDIPDNKNMVENGCYWK